MAKLSKQQVDFEHPASGMDHCEDCKFYLGGACSLVAGSIAPEDWCKRFSMKTNEIKDIGFGGDEEAEKSQPTAKPKKDGCEHPGECFGACNEKTELPYMHEHDTVKSRLTGKDHEIGLGPQGGGQVSKNPFASLAQEGFLHAHPEKLGAKKLAEFDAATKGKKLPKRVKK